MKTQKVYQLFSLLLCMTVIASCGQSTESVATSSTIATLPVSSASPTESAMTLTPVATGTPTPIPTLSAEDARERLLNLLVDNGGCHLPCLLGITPGKTTNLEARAILLPFSSISISMYLSDNSPDSIWLTYNESDLRTSIKLSYLFASNAVISRIAFKAEESKELPDGYLPVYDSKTFGERLRPYMLPGILSEFGKPVLVVLHTSGKQITGSGGFEILLLYPDEGIFVRYTTQMETVGTKARGCPANAQVELELYPSGDADAFAESLAEMSLGGIFDGLELVDNPSWKSIDKATSMSLEQFYETFRQPTDKCIETPLKGWYVP